MFHCQENTICYTRYTGRISVKWHRVHLKSSDGESQVDVASKVDPGPAERKRRNIQCGARFKWKLCMSLLNRARSCDSKQMNGNTAKSSHWLRSSPLRALCYERTIQASSGELVASAADMGQNLILRISFTFNAFFFSAEIIICTTLKPKKKKLHDFISGSFIPNF